MKPNLRGFDRLTRVVLAAIFGWLAVYGYSEPIVRVIAGGFALYSLFEAVTGSCPLFAHFGVRGKNDRLKAEDLNFLGLLGVQVTLAYVWIAAGAEKLVGPFSADLAKTLGFFASKNPYPAVASFLTGVAAPNADVFAPIVAWGELAVGIVLAICTIVIVYGKAKDFASALDWSVAALLAGAVMNAVFWLAAGWTGPGTATANVAMFWPELALVYVWTLRIMTKK